MLTVAHMFHRFHELHLARLTLAPTKPQISRTSQTTNHKYQPHSQAAADEAADAEAAALGDAGLAMSPGLKARRLAEARQALGLARGAGTGTGQPLGRAIVTTILLALNACSAAAWLHGPSPTVVGVLW